MDYVAWEIGVDNRGIMRHKQPLNDMQRAHEKEGKGRGRGRVALHARLWCVHRKESMTNKVWHRG